MRIYAEEQEERLLLRRRAAAWLRAGFVSPAQAAAIDGENASDLRTAGFFFRVLLFFFTMMALSAIFWMAVWAFRLGGWRSMGPACLLFAAACYAAAERAASRHRLHRHGIEEAAAVAALGWSSAGFYLAFIESQGYGHKGIVALCLWVAFGAGWFYKRFGFLYAALGAAAALASIPFQYNFSETALRLVLAGMSGLFFFLSLRASGPGKGDVRRGEGAFLQAVFLLGAYLALNVRLPALGAAVPWIARETGFYPEAWSGPAWFYWGSYGAVIAIPAALILAGILLRRKLFLDMGILTAVLTLAVNKDYWGWTHHPWDPAVLGALLGAIGWGLSRRLKGRRTGFTAEDLGRPSSHGLELAALGAAVLSPRADPGSSGVRMGGGASGGGGASAGF